MSKPGTRLTLTLIASLFIFFTVFSQPEKERIANYIQQYKEIAMSEMIRTGIPASITLAQGLLETGCGQSDLALNANNHFGIKCKSDWTGESILHDDDKKGECFRKYANAEDSYRDHSDFLLRPNYKFLFAIDPFDYQGWAYGLKKAGYATNPAYAQKLIKYIEDNNLQEYTLTALQQKSAGKDEPWFAAANTEVKKEDNDEVTTEANTTFIEKDEIVNNNAAAPVTVNENKEGYPKNKLFNINGLKVLFVEAGTSLFAIASINNISYNKLLEFNDLDKVDITEKDQLIFLERKQRKGIKDYHVVVADEDLYTICQQEGIQLNSILDFNHLPKGSKPAIGQRLYLKAAAPVAAKLAANINDTAVGG